jgi:cysteine desulfuration protein SufE
MSIQEKEAEVIEEFAFFDDWLSKYDHLIELGRELPLIDETKKTAENIIKGCQSQVWLDAHMEYGKVQFRADSDAIITKGIISLLIRVLGNEEPQDIVNCELRFLDEIGLKEHLSPTRANGLLAMVKQMKFYALAFSAKN